MSQESLNNALDALRDEIIGVYRKHLPKLSAEMHSQPPTDGDLMVAFIAASTIAQITFTEEFSTLTDDLRPSIFWVSVFKALQMVGGPVETMQSAMSGRPLQ